MDLHKFCSLLNTSVLDVRIENDNGDVYFYITDSYDSRVMQQSLGFRSVLFSYRNYPNRS